MEIGSTTIKVSGNCAIISEEDFKLLKELKDKIRNPAAAVFAEREYYGKEGILNNLHRHDVYVLSEDEYFDSLQQSLVNLDQKYLDLLKENYDLKQELSQLKQKQNETKTRRPFGIF